MRNRLLAGVGVAVVTLGSVLSSTAATAAPQGTEPVSIEDALPPVLCGFPISIDVVANSAFKTTQNLADGSTVTNTHGNLVLTFTNEVNGKSFTRNVSGPSTATTRPDNTSTYEGAGTSWFGLGPGGQRNTSLPGLIITSGKVNVQITGNTVQTLTVRGKVENGCALLS